MQSFPVTPSGYSESFFRRFGSPRRTRNTSLFYREDDFASSAGEVSHDAVGRLLLSTSFSLMCVDSVTSWNITYASSEPPSQSDKQTDRQPILAAELAIPDPGGATSLTDSELTVSGGLFL